LYTLGEVKPMMNCSFWYTGEKYTRIIQ